MKEGTPAGADSPHKSYSLRPEIPAEMGDGSRLPAALAERVGIDARALAAFRIYVGLLLCADLLLRARNLRAFYTDAGVLPRDIHAELYPTLARVSLHTLSGALWWQALLFVVAFGFALLLTVGYRTRVSAVASWLLLASLQARNDYVLNGGDTVLLVVLFVALFLPLGRRWSLDARASDGADATATPAVGFGTAALLSQVVLIYATNAVFKFRSDAWMAGEAVPQVFQVERFVVFLGPYISEFTALLVAINWLWVAMLAASPLLLLARGWLRATLVALYMGAHLAMRLTMDLGLFSEAMVAGLLVFLPPVVWDRVESAVEPLINGVGDWLDARPGIDAAVQPSRAVLPSGLRRGAARALPVATALVLVVGLLWQVAAVGVVATPEDAPVDPAEHSWKLFAPNPPASDGWYVTTAETAAGEEVDVYPHADTGFDPPDDIADTYPNARWRKYLTGLQHGSDRRIAAFADYLCRTGAETHGERLTEVEIVFVHESAHSDERTRQDLGTYRCRSA
ncbi:HTTM domain-containing protein [Natronomonas amylolytica]|uniref:HTTM domain-containing protein n=1 Tax=Natronomonas amylolytica TaxID=3108498 RepID=UPI00300BFA06